MADNEPTGPRLGAVRLIRRVSLRQLEVFTAAARELNFSRVAESLHLSQPAVSIQIRQVEEAAGLPLFERNGRQKRLTEAGKLLLHHVSRAYGELADAEQGLQAIRGLAGGSVGLGLVSTAKYFAPQLVSRFAAVHPQIDVRFVAGNREQLVQLLQENRIDLALMGRPPAKMDTASEVLAANPHVLVAAADHPLHAARGINLQALSAENFLIREPGSGTRTVMEELFHEHDFHPEHLVVMDSNETVKQSVMAGLGLSLLSLSTLALELRSNAVALLNVRGLPVERNWHVVHLRKRLLSPPANAFRGFLIDNTQAVLASMTAKRAAPKPPRSRSKTAAAASPSAPKKTRRRTARKNRTP